MSGREWKPGDVAMVTARWIRTDDHSERYAVRRPDGWWSRAGVHVGDWEVSAVRPLVVIDPEDREQVERLDDLIYSDRFDHEDTVDGTQAALREFANPKPPKPEEPTGLGAVVEDAQGDLWIRRSFVPEWFHAKGNAFSLKWDSLSVVRVLSEGVQAGEQS